MWLDELFQTVGRCIRLAFLYYTQLHWTFEFNGSVAVLSANALNSENVVWKYQSQDKYTTHIYSERLDNVIFSASLFGPAKHSMQNMCANAAHVCAIIVKAR